jgi:hypothetical protein
MEIKQEQELEQLKERGKHAGRKKHLRESYAKEAARMKINPLVMDQTDRALWHKYPELKDIVYPYVEGKYNKDQYRRRAVNFMVWLYSDDTVLNTKPIEPLRDRKYKALDFAGFKMNPETNDYDEQIMDELFNLLDMDFVDMVLKYLIWQKNDLWTEIVVSSEQHHEVTRLRLQPVTGKDSKQTMEAADTKKKLRLESKELLMDIKQYWDEFWEDHVDLKQVGQERLYRSIEDRARINVGA